MELASDHSSVAVRLGLNERHRQFVEEYANCGDPGRAAVAAGFSERYGNHLLRMPVIAAATYAHLQQKFMTEGATVGFKVLIDTCRNDLAPPGVKVKAAQLLLDRAGHVPPKASAVSDERDLTAMSQTELLAVINQAESELADRAKPISAPIGKPNATQAADIFE